MSDQKENLPRRSAEKPAIPSRADEISSVRVVLPISYSFDITLLLRRATALA